MIKFKPVIRLTQKRQDETFNLKIAVSHNRTTGYLSTDYYVYEKEIDKKGRLNSLYRSHKDANEINLSVSVLIGGYSGRAKKLKDPQHYSMKMLLGYLREEGDPTDLITILNSRITAMERVGNVNYMGTFKQTKALIEDKLGYKVLPLEVITPDWLAKQELELKTKGMAPNAIGVHMRNIRTCFNEAITLGRIDLSSYPFRKYKIPRAKTRKRNITREEMQSIITMEIKEPLMRWARDMFILSFYLIGINMRDLMYIERIEEGRIYYIRSKGKKDYSIKVHPQAQEIINRYPGKKYLLNTMDYYADYRTATKRINYKLKDIATKLEISKVLTTYIARHTWATIASSKEVGISRDTIRYALGHSLGTVTDIYIDYDLEQVDQANKAVIDYVNIPPCEPAP